LIDEESEDESDDQSAQGQEKGDFGKILGSHKGDPDDVTNRPSVAPGDSLGNSNRAIKASTQGQENILQEVEMDLIREIMGEDSFEEKNHLIIKAKAIAIQKSVQNVLKTKTYEKSTLFYYIVSSISILLQLVFVIWINFYVSNSCDGAQKTENILQGAYFRDFWIKIANQQARLWVNARKDVSSAAGLDNFEKQNLKYNQTFHELSNFNQNLRLLLSDTDSDIQNLFFVKNVNVYDREAASANLVLQSVDDASQVTEKIITKGFANVNKPLPATNAIDPDSRFIFDNSFNDLLAESEATLEKVEHQSSENLKDSKRVVLIVLIATLAVIAIFVIFSIHSMVQINNQYLKFMRALFTIPRKDAAKTQVILTAFNEQLIKDCDDEDFIRGLTMTELDWRIRKSQSTGLGLMNDRDKKGYRRSFHKASMHKLYTRNRTTFCGLFGALLIMIVLMVVYYDIALNKMTSFEIQTAGKVFILKALNRQAFVNVQVQALIMDNVETKVRNEPILDSLDNDISILYNVNAFQEALFDEQGDLSQGQQTILFNMSCSDAYSSLYFLSQNTSTSVCDTVSKGIKRLSLVSLLPDIVNSASLLIEDFENSSKDALALQLIFNEAVASLNDLSDIATILMLLLFTATEIKFQEKMQSLDDTRLIVICIAIAVSVILGSLTWIFVIRKLVDRSFERKRVLAIIPNRLITANPYLKMYLFVLAKDNHEGVQHFMNS